MTVMSMVPRLPSDDVQFAAFTFSLAQGIRMTTCATGKSASLLAFCFCWADLFFHFSVAERLLFLVALVLSGTGPPNHPQKVRAVKKLLASLMEKMGPQGTAAALQAA